MWELGFLNHRKARSSKKIKVLHQPLVGAGWVEEGLTHANASRNHSRHIARDSVFISCNMNWFQNLFNSWSIDTLRNKVAKTNYSSAFSCYKSFPAYPIQMKSTSISFCIHSFISMPNKFFHSIWSSQFHYINILDSNRVEKFLAPSVLILHKSLLKSILKRVFVSKSLMVS